MVYFFVQLIGINTETRTVKSENKRYYYQRENLTYAQLQFQLDDS
jgi:hypothetical protein